MPNIHDSNNTVDSNRCAPAFFMSRESGLTVALCGDVELALRPRFCTDAALARLNSTCLRSLSTWPCGAPSLICLIRAATSLDSSVILQMKTNIRAWKNTISDCISNNKTESSVPRLQRINDASNLNHLVQKVLNRTHRELAVGREHWVQLLNVPLNLPQIVARDIEELALIRLQFWNQDTRMARRDCSARRDAKIMCASDENGVIRMGVRKQSGTIEKMLNQNESIVYLWFWSNWLRKCCRRDSPLDINSVMEALALVKVMMKALRWRSSRSPANSFLRCGYAALRCNRWASRFRVGVFHRVSCSCGAVAIILAKIELCWVGCETVKDEVASRTAAEFFESIKAVTLSSVIHKSNVTQRRKYVVWQRRMISTNETAILQTNLKKLLPNSGEASWPNSCEKTIRTSHAAKSTGFAAADERAVSDSSIIFSAVFCERKIERSAPTVRTL